MEEPSANSFERRGAEVQKGMGRIQTLTRPAAGTEKRLPAPSVMSFAIFHVTFKTEENILLQKHTIHLVFAASSTLVRTLELMLLNYPYLNIIGVT